jgi:hypothetical protein
MPIAKANDNVATCRGKLREMVMNPPDCEMKKKLGA